MPRTLVLSIAVSILLCAARASAQPLVAETEALSAEEQLRTFQVPPGFEIQLVAAEPEIRKPINLAFDAAGRLYATESVEYPYAAAEDAEHRDSVKVFWDFAADGHAQQTAVAVDGLNIPIGVAPLTDSLLVYSIRDGVMRCWDRDGDGRYEDRKPILTGFGFDDTHGMINALTPWVDGWVYACHGFRNDSRTQAADGSAVEMNSGNTFRFRPDGSRVEPWTRGQVNPFGLSFDPLGNLFSADCHTLPAYQLLRGAWYPSFGKPHDGLGYGPTMISHNHGSTGIAGIVYYAADRFPAEWRDTLFIGNPVTGRVNHDRLDRHGSTLLAVEQPDFVSTTDGWFRPVDIELGPDGALYVADFYNRIIGHYEVPLDHPGRDRERGRIWRIVYTGDGAAPPAPPDITRANADELIALLDSPNLPLRVQAVNQLVERIGAKAVEPLQRRLSGNATPAQRAYGAWVLERLGALDEFSLLSLLADPEPVVGVQATRILAERPQWDGGVHELLHVLLPDRDAFKTRAAADALARHPRADHVARLLDVWAAAAADDTHLVHAVRMALRDQLLAEGVYEQVAADFGGDSAALARLAEISLGAPTPQSAAFVLDYLGREANVAARAELVRHTARHLEDARLAELYDLIATWRDLPVPEQIAVARALFYSLQERGLGLANRERFRAAELASYALSGSDEGLAREGLDITREMRLAECFAEAEALARRDSPLAGLRSTAIDTCVAADGPRSIDLLSEILGDGLDPIDLRQKAAVALGGLAEPRAAETLLAQLPTVPEPVAVAIAIGLAGTPAGSESLLAAISAGKASARVLQDRAVEERLRVHNLPDFDARLAALTADLPPAEARFAELIEQRRQRFPQVAVDFAIGQQAFKKTCAACHRLAGEGTKIGPELDGIGLRGLDRLLEDLLDPSRNVDQAFRSTQIVTTDGRPIVGLKLREEGQVLVLADAQGKEVRVPLEEIEEQALTPLSPMPANVAEVVPEADFYHLLGYLLSQREKPASE
jgi:putative heme-binding domain-containing protein